MIETWTEAMNGHFDKLHIRGLGVVHRFTAADGPDAPFHDHPWRFTTRIVRGGYVEQIWRNGFILEIERKEGQFIRWRNPIHRIVALTAPVCWTLCDYGPFRGHEAEFWRADGDRLVKVAP